MEPIKKLSVIKQDGGILGPADRDTLRRWAEEGSIDVNDQIELTDGRRTLVMEDAELRLLVETAGRNEVKHLGLRDLLVGAFMLGLAVVLTVGSVLAPKALNLVPGHGTYGVSQVFWWILMAMLALAGGTLLFRGLRERKRARYLEAASF